MTNSPRVPVVEVFRCDNCGTDFARVRVAGAKPRNCPPCKQAYSQAYYQARRERIRERHREWARASSAANPEAVAAYARKWYAANRERVRERRAVTDNRRRVATKSGDLTAGQWAEIRAEYCHRCAYCGEAATAMDHVDPISRGGEHTADNVVPACRHCNSSKGARFLLEYLVAREAKRARLSTRQCLGV